jgi:hypothetical protein
MLTTGSDRPEADGGHYAHDSVMCPKVMSLFFLANVALLPKSCRAY